MIFLLLFTELSDDEPCPTQHLKRIGHGDELWKIGKFLDSRWKNLPLMTLKNNIPILV